jgi:hypothetical protein
VRQFFRMQIDRPAAGLAMHAHVGHVPEPPGRDFVQVLQRTELAAAQQAAFHVLEGTFDFAFGLRTPGAAGHRPVAVVRGEGQETRIVDGLIVFVPRDHDFHAVVQAGRRDTAQVFEGPDVLPLGRLHVLRFDEPQVLAARVAEDQAEQVDPPPTFLREVQRIAGVVHLGLHAGAGLEPLGPRRLGLRTQLGDTLAEDTVAPRVTVSLQFFLDPANRDLGIPREEILNPFHVRIDQTPALRWWSLQLGRHGALLALQLVQFQCVLHRLAGDLQLAGHATHRLTAVPTANDLVADFGIHVLRLLISCGVTSPEDASRQGELG